MDNLYEVAQKVNEEMFQDCDFVPTCGGRGQRHPHNLVGNMFRINNPESVRVGDCFLAGRLKKGDLFLCTNHSGDCFQNYIYIREYANCLVSEPKWSFGSYGIGDSEIVKLNPGEFDILKSGGRVEREIKTERKKEDIEFSSLTHFPIIDTSKATKFNFTVEALSKLIII